MGLRKAGSYSKMLHIRPYTRTSKVKSKNYIKTVPHQNIVKFRMGEIKDYDKGKLKNIIKLVASERVLIRDNALEASRQFVHKLMEEELLGQYYFEVKPFPHHILRENKMITGAGADRMQTGMQQSFGVTVGRAALVNPGETIFLVATFHEKSKALVAKSFKQIKSKLPCRSHIVFEKRA